MEVQIKLAQLFPAQKTIVDSPARFKVLACGRRFGKTSIALDVLSNLLLDGKSVAYFAPTYRMGSEVWRALSQLLYPLIRTANEGDWRMELYTGGVFEGWSLLSGERVRGRKYHYVVIDEAALFDSADVWHGAIRPLLTDYEGGALFASTPKGRGWFWQLYQQGQSGDYPEWESWRFPTHANPYINPKEVEAAKQGMPERFYRQEYEAVFLDDGGVVFRNVEGVCVLRPHPLTPSPQSMEGEQTFFGVDWGKDNDYTAISVMTREGRQVWLERFNQIGWAAQRGRLAALYEQFQPRVILAEANSVGSVNIEALQQEGLPVHPFLTTLKSKAPLIDGLALAMEREEVLLLDDPVLKHELMAYEVSRTSHGWSYSAPSGGHDDTVIATALSLWASQRYAGLGFDFV
jgi:hypothetical protein